MSKLTQEKLKRLLSYDPKTGIFRWKVRRYGIQKGSVAGTIAHGYREITIDGGVLLQPSVGVAVCGRLFS